MFRFEKLDVWHKLVSFAGRVFDVTKVFPPNEQFGLTSQMRRAALPISSNIAEGSSRSSDAEFSRFIQFAYGSRMGVVSQFVIAKQPCFLSDHDHKELNDLVQQLSRMLSGLESRLHS